MLAYNALRKQVRVVKSSGIELSTARLCRSVWGVRRVVQVPCGGRCADLFSPFFGFAQRSLSLTRYHTLVQFKKNGYLLQIIAASGRWRIGDLYKERCRELTSRITILFSMPLYRYERELMVHLLRNPVGRTTHVTSWIKGLMNRF